MSTQTNYSRAWLQFTTTQAYNRTVGAFIKNGMKQPYINNIIQNAFEAGWNASGVKIEILQTPTP